MKKRICMLMTVVMAVSVLALAGCGGGGSKAAETKAPQTTEAVTEAPTEKATEAQTEAPTEAVTEAVTEASAEVEELAGYTTIREYLDYPAVADQIEEIEKSSSNDSLTLEIEAEGDNTLFYKCTYTEQYDSEQASLIKENLEGLLEGDDFVSQMTNVIDTIEGSSQIKGLKVKTSYYLPDGTLLAERTVGGE